MPTKNFTLVSESIFLLGDAPIVFVTTIRQRKADTFEVGCFVIDAGCLGVKDAWFETATPNLDELKEHYFKEGYREKSGAWGRHFVESAIAYARNLGFKPHRDYKKAARVFGGIKASDCNEDFEFGREGKPFYFKGPNDDPATAQKIINQLRRKCGEDGFHFIAEISDEKDPLAEQIEQYLQWAQEGRIAEAFTQMQSLLKKNPDHAKVLYGWALLLVLDGDKASAVSYFQKSIEQDASDEYAWFNLGLTYRDLRNIPRMLSALQEAIRLGNEHSEFWSDAQDLMATGNKIAEECGISLDDYIRSGIDFELGIQLMENGEIERSLERFQTAAQRNPHSHQSFGNMGTCLIQLGRIQEAREALQQSLNIDPKYKAAKNNLKLIKKMKEGTRLSMDKLVIQDFSDEA